MCWVLVASNFELSRVEREPPGSKRSHLDQVANVLEHPEKLWGHAPYFLTVH